MRSTFNEAMISNDTDVIEVAIDSIELDTQSKELELGDISDKISMLKAMSKNIKKAIEENRKLVWELVEKGRSL